ncbi:hypothetical protein [Mycobacterium asiaticum]|uniref:Uncharacterized protein n=1 Tax=Mycobacterium asiaticum TaxID=1790 RepID=A0A1A3BK12_MYCAS|nr:hypothetical protein [Mycobacterium asiaticum]OBI74643.1 hypothetical protein A9X01_05325 [Mycobacterium asiaticum]
MSTDDRTLADLTAQMNGWKSGTGAELLLEDAHAAAFLDRVEAAKADLQQQLTGANGLQAWLSGADVGTYVSATTTRQHLEEDIAEFIEAVSSYIHYLDALTQTAAAACQSIRNADQPHS